MLSSVIRQACAVTRALGGSFARNDAANTTVAFALSIPVVLGAVGGAVEFSLAAAERSKMQAAADTAAISSAREFQVAQTTPEKIAAVARSYVTSKLSDVSVQTKVDAQAHSVEVAVEKDIQTTIGRLLWNGTLHLRAVATAKMSGGLPLCLIGLDPDAAGTITLRKNARLTAPGCTAYSNSNSPVGIKSLDNAVMRAGFICSVGGRMKTRNTNFVPEPLTDCPVLPDPLASRQGPTDFTCNFTNKIVDGDVATLKPGVYCGGLTVRSGSKVTLSSGIYIFKNGPLSIRGDASLKGTNVAFYMKGAGANLSFAAGTTIELTATKDGPLAGILIFDDPTGAPAPDQSGKHPRLNRAPREHSILSDNARVLLGTIYMPKGRLIIDATKPIADRSAYTVLVVQQLDLYEGPNLYLNTDYGATDVPVPEGVGPYGGKVMLTN
jgi:hypothetical protein